MYSIIKDIVEIIYFLSGPIIAFLAFKGLKQISLTKELANINAKRESYKLAVEECRKFSDEIVPIIDSFNEKVTKYNIRYFKESKVEIGNNQLTVEPFINYKEHPIVIQNVVNEVYILINKLIAFSLFFISGIAAEEVAFTAAAEIYCATIKKLSPVLVKQPDFNSDDSLVKLFFIWYKRLEVVKAKKEMEKLENIINDNKTTIIKPIGT
jgi:hypothetical protein